jgi:hypothetical protein
MKKTTLNTYIIASLLSLGVSASALAVTMPTPGATDPGATDPGTIFHGTTVPGTSATGTSATGTSATGTTLSETEKAALVDQIEKLFGSISTSMEDRKNELNTNQENKSKFVDSFGGQANEWKINLTVETQVKKKELTNSAIEAISDIKRQLNDIYAKGRTYSLQPSVASQIQQLGLDKTNAEAGVADGLKAIDAQYALKYKEMSAKNSDDYNTQMKTFNENAVSINTKYDAIITDLSDKVSTLKKTYGNLLVIKDKATLTQINTIYSNQSKAIASSYLAASKVEMEKSKTDVAKLDSEKNAKLTEIVNAYKPKLAESDTKIKNLQNSLKTITSNTDKKAIYDSIKDETLNKTSLMKEQNELVQPITKQYSDIVKTEKSNTELKLTEINSNADKQKKDLAKLKLVIDSITK